MAKTIQEDLKIQIYLKRYLARILAEVNKYGFIDDENIFIDGTHIKANANNHKYKNEVIEESARSI